MESSDAMPLPMVLMIVGFFTVIAVIAVTVATVSARGHRPIAQEQVKAERLAADGLRVEGRVTAWMRGPGGDEDALRLRLRVRFAFNGSAHEAELMTRVDRGLLLRFAPGSSIHLLVDPEEPDQVAVDRETSPVGLPRSW